MKPKISGYLNPYSKLLKCTGDTTPMMACETTTGLLEEDSAIMNPDPQQPWLKGEEEIKNEFTLPHAQDQLHENTNRKLVFYR